MKNINYFDDVDVDVIYTIKCKKCGLNMKMEHELDTSINCKLCDEMHLIHGDLTESGFSDREKEKHLKVFGCMI